MKLQKINDDELDSAGAIAWLTNELKVSNNRARHLHNLFRQMGLYSLTHDLCSLTDGGQELIQKNTARPIVRGLIDAIEYVDKMLPRILQEGGATEDGMVGYLAEEHDEIVKRYKIRCRLKWFSGLGLGLSKGRRLILSDEGKVIIDQVLREIEIRERDLREQEDDKKKLV